MGHILKNKQKSKRVCIHEITQLIITKNGNENEKIDHIDTANIYRGRGKNTNIINKKSDLV